MRRRHSCLGVALAIAALHWCSACVAAEPLDKVRVRAGGYLTQFDSSIWRDDDEDRIDFDRELGLEEHTLIESAGIAWRPWERHGFGLDYFNQSLSGIRLLDREIVLEDEVFPLNTTVHSTFILESLEFHYTWWMFSREEWAFGPRIGYVGYRMQNRVEMLLGEAGEPPAVRVEAYWEDRVPSATIGVDFRYIPGEHWRVSANAGWFKAKFKTVSPEITSARAGVEYFFGRNVGVWVDYGLTHLDVDVHSSHFDGTVEIYEGGLRLGVTWRM